MIFQGSATQRGEVTFGPGDHRVPWSHTFEVAEEASDGGPSRSWAPAVAVSVALALLLLVVVFRKQPRHAGAAAFDEAPP